MFHSSSIHYLNTSPTHHHPFYAQGSGVGTAVLDKVDDQFMQNLPKVVSNVLKNLTLDAATLLVATELLCDAGAGNGQQNDG